MKIIQSDKKVKGQKDLDSLKGLDDLIGHDRALVDGLKGLYEKF